MLNTAHKLKASWFRYVPTGCVFQMIELQCHADKQIKSPSRILWQKTSGYATWFTAGGAIRIAHYDVIDDVIPRKLRDREKRRPPRRMKSSELSNGGNRIALWQLLQNRKWRHLWRHNLGWRWKLQKMTPENFSIDAFYNITKNQHNPIKTVGWDSFLRAKTPKNNNFLGVTKPPGVAQPLYSTGHT